MMAKLFSSDGNVNRKELYPQITQIVYDICVICG
jgi:hypothetical protein